MYNTSLTGYKLLHVSRLCYQFSRCTLGNKLLSSQMAKSDRSSYVYGSWLDSTSSDNYRPGNVQYFLKHTVTLEKQNKETVTLHTFLAYIGWYKPHPEAKFLHSPISLYNLWYPEIEPLSAASFMPINRVACQCAQVQAYMKFPERPYNNGEVVIIIPISGIVI